MEYENTFVREVKEKNITEPSEILNWYRNLYHTEDNHTEHGIMAYAINDFFADVVPKSEVEKLNAEIEVLKAERNNYQTWYFQTVTEFEDAKVEIETLKDNNEHLAVMLEEAKSEVERLEYGDKLLFYEGKAWHREAELNAQRIMELEAEKMLLSRIMPSV